jgi:hypothetical protein
MTVIGEFAPDAAAGARAAVATRLRELFPGSDPPWVAPLRPDLLAGQLLPTCVQLSDLILVGYASAGKPEQLEQLLAELTRANTRPAVRQALGQLLDAHLPVLFTGAVDRPSSRLPDLLDLALPHCPQPEAAVALVSQLPERSTGLAALAATLTSQQVTSTGQAPAAENRMPPTASPAPKTACRSGWATWDGGRRRWPPARKPRESTGSRPPGGSMSTTTSWNSRCKLLPSLKAAKTSTTHLRGTLRSDNGPLSLAQARAFVPIAPDALIQAGLG